METRLRKRESPEWQDTELAGLFGAVVEVIVRDVAVGAVMRSVSYKKVPDSLWLSERSP